MPEKRYIGDGVYAAVEGCSILLTAENGISVQQTIYIALDDLPELERYIADFKKGFA